MSKFAVAVVAALAALVSACESVSPVAVPEERGNRNGLLVGGNNIEGGDSASARNGLLVGGNNIEPGDSLGS